MNHRLNAMDSLDACVFSSDMLYNDAERQAFKEHLARWNKAMQEHDGGRGECEVCGGSGIDPEPHVYQVCCNRPTPSGECCGNPRPEQEQQACRECSRPSVSPPQQEQAAPGAVQDGFVMVPVVATKEMCKAAVIFANGNAVYKNVAAGALEVEEQIYGEAYAAMIAAAPKAVVQDGWMPIETAPKDGTPIILCREDRVTAGHWEPEKWPSKPEYHSTTGEYLGQFETGECYPAWWYSEDGGFEDDYPPTHWMHLPAAPKAQEPGA